MKHSWHARELAHAFGMDEDTVRLNLYTLGIYEVSPGRFPLKAHTLLTAMNEGYPICRTCLRTGDVGPCQCKGHIERLNA